MKDDTKKTIDNLVKDYEKLVRKYEKKMEAPTFTTTILFHTYSLILQCVEVDDFEKVISLVKKNAITCKGIYAQE